MNLNIFSVVAITAASAVLLAVLLIIIRLMISLPPKRFVSYAFPDTVNPYFLSFGAILFAFSGASTFPTIQHDMKEPHKFGIAVVVGTFSKCYVLIAMLSILANGS